jgi:diguanylate cyclase (GGDEF)-like protein
VDSKHLIELTNASLKEIRKHEIITPSLYSSIFYDKAKELGLLDKFEKDEIDNVENIISKVQSIQNETKESAKTLNENAKEAQKAILKKDTSSLFNVENKMDSLLERIAKLQEQVYRDELTKVYNRKYLFEEVLEDDSFKKDGNITFIDLDKFKIINDTYGHIIGDKVLIMIATMINRYEGGDAIRYGGDEFILVSDQPIIEVQKFFEEIEQKLAKKSFKHQDRTFKVGFSYGIESFEAGESFNEIVERVDVKMYQQKKEKKAREKKETLNA